MDKRRGRWDETSPGARKCARSSRPASHIRFVEPLKGFTLEPPDEEWVSSLGLTKLLNVMCDGVSLVEYNAQYKEFVQEFRILNEGPTLQCQTTVHEGAHVRGIAIDAKTFAAQFEIQHNPDGMQLGGSREAKWPEGYKYFEKDKSAYDSKKGWRLEKLKPEYSHLTKKYELLHRLIWFRKRSDYIGNGQIRTIHDVCTCDDPLRQPDWATVLLRNFAHEVRSLQSIAERGTRHDQVTLIGPIIRQILYSDLCDRRESPVKDSDKCKDLTERCQNDVEPDDSEEAVTSRDGLEQVQDDDAEGSLSAGTFKSRKPGDRDSADRLIRTAGRDTSPGEREALHKEGITSEDTKVLDDRNRAAGGFEILLHNGNASELGPDGVATGFQAVNLEPDPEPVADDDIQSRNHYKNLRMFNNLSESNSPFDCLSTPFPLWNRTLPPSAPRFSSRLEELFEVSACLDSAPNKEISSSLEPHRSQQTQNRPQNSSDISGCCEESQNDKGQEAEDKFSDIVSENPQHAAQATPTMTVESRANMLLAAAGSGNLCSWSSELMNPPTTIAMHPSSTGVLVKSFSASAPTPSIPTISEAGTPPPVVPAMLVAGTTRGSILHRAELPQTTLTASLARFLKKMKDRYNAKDLSSSPSQQPATPQENISANPSESQAMECALARWRKDEQLL